MMLKSKASGTEAKSKRMHWYPDTVLLDEYRVEGLLGEGGMGQVYLVMSLSTGYRYALKKCKIARDEDVRNFFAELQTWIGLPEHRNLAACRFFRSVSGDIVIFSDYIEGGSLADMIREKRLKGLADILDIAIQFADGLHVVHEQGLVHQDVKPGNVLVTPQLVAKVADFGLARARQYLSTNNFPAVMESDTLLVPGSGYMTQAYASPEQMSGLPLSRKSDIWSWAVSVLEMFTGEVTWQAGNLAGEALEQYVEHSQVGNRLPAMPSEVVDLLRNCFFRQPDRRIPTLMHAVNILRNIYRQQLNGEHLPSRDSLTVASVAETVTCKDNELPWVAPQQWLMIALEKNGQNPLDAARFMAREATSIKSRALSDLDAYAMALKLFDNELHYTDVNHICQYACLCIDKASVHDFLGDDAGAMTLFDRAISLLARTPDDNEIKTTAFISSARGKAQLLLKHGQIDEAFLLFKQALEASVLLKGTVHWDAASEIAVSVRLGMAQIERERDNPSVAMSIYSEALVHAANLRDAANVSLSIQCLIGRIQAASELEDLDSVARDISSATALIKDGESTADFTWARIALAIQAGELASARGAYTEASAILSAMIAEIKALSQSCGGLDIREQLAAIQVSMASILVSDGNIEGALAFYDAAFPEYERAVRESGRFEITGTLTKILSERALCIHRTGDFDAAISAYDKAISILEHLSNKHNDWRLQNNLATLLMNKANAVAEAHDRQTATMLYDRAIDLRTGLEGRMPASIWARGLAVVLTNKSEYMLAEGMHAEARQLCDNALALLERARPQRHDSQWNGYVSWIIAHRAESLWFAGSCEEASQAISNAIMDLRSAIQEVNSPTLRWALKDAEIVQSRISNKS